MKISYVPQKNYHNKKNVIFALAFTFIFCYFLQGHVMNVFVLYLEK